MLTDCDETFWWKNIDIHSNGPSNLSDNLRKAIVFFSTVAFCSEL